MVANGRRVRLVRSWSTTAPVGSEGVVIVSRGGNSIKWDDPCVEGQWGYPGWYSDHTVSLYFEDVTDGPW